MSGSIQCSLAGIAWFAAASVACAQSPQDSPASHVAASAAPGWTIIEPGGTGQHFYLGVPMFASSANGANDFAAMQVQKGSGGTVYLSNSEGNSFIFNPGVHGFISAGIGSRGTRGLDGEVTVPLVPGKVDLSIAATTGRSDVFLPLPFGTARQDTLSYQGYRVSLAVHPTDDFEAIFAVEGGHFGLH